MSLCATGSYVRLIRCLRQRIPCRANQGFHPPFIRLFSLAGSAQVDVVKGGNRTGRKRRKTELLSQTKQTFREEDEADDWSHLEESVHGLEGKEVDEELNIRKIGMTKPKHVAFSQYLQRRANENTGENTRPETDLPLPPFLRETRPSTRFDQWYKNGTYTFFEFEKQSKMESKAPFATAFAQNPYARALATPLRQDAFTGARLPKACLLDFHLADDVDNNKLKLMPLSLAAALLPSRKWNADEKHIKQMDRDESVLAPEGTASYIAAKREAIHYISEEPKSRTRKRAVSLRMQKALEKDYHGSKLEWNAQMGGIVLKSMRQIVRRRLRQLMLPKTTASSEGVIAALPSQYGLHALDAVDNVNCVLRLQPVSPDDTSQASRNPEPKDPKRSHFWPNMTSFLGDTYGEWDYETPAQRWAREDVARADGGKPPLDTQHPSRSTSEQHVLDHWSAKDLRGAPFLGHCLPLPGPCVPGTWYYPTMRYRSQRVPFYHLPVLLGDEEMGKVLADTVFTNVTWATISQPWRSGDLQIWLFKLETFLAKSKEETEKG